MSSLGDVTSRQKDLRSRLLEWRSTLAQRDQKDGFSESKECKDKENGKPSENVRCIPVKFAKSKKEGKKEPVDTLVWSLHLELEKQRVKEQQDAELRKEEHAELLQLRAERESFLMERFRGDALRESAETLKENLDLTQTRLELAMEAVNVLHFEKACLDQQLAEWKGKISTHVSNVKEMAQVRDREKDIVYRARKDREREVKLLKEAHANEKKAQQKERVALEKRSDDMVVQLNAQMQSLRTTALEKIALLERQLAQAHGRVEGI